MRGVEGRTGPQLRYNHWQWMWCLKKTHSNVFRAPRLSSTDFYPANTNRTGIYSMKQLLFILIVTGAFAIAATFLAWALGGKQEDVANAIGGILGFAVANGVVIRFLKPGAHGARNYKSSSETGFSYGVFAIAYFAFVGWLTGYLHGHGDLAGTVCGGLGGFIPAVMVPALHRSPFLASGRRLQFAMSVVALAALLGIVWVWYLPEFIY